MNELDAAKAKFIEGSLRLTRVLRSRNMETSKSFKEWLYPCTECIVRAMCKKELFGDSCDEYFEWFVEKTILSGEDGEENGNES